MMDELMVRKIENTEITTWDFTAIKAQLQRGLDEYASIVYTDDSMHLYYTNCPDGNPWITFEWTGKAIEKTISDIREIIRQIENKSYERCAENAFVCSFCEMRNYCGRAK